MRRLPEKGKAMEGYKKILAGFGWKNGNGVYFDGSSLGEGATGIDLACRLGDQGADELMFWDYSETDKEHEAAIGFLKEVIRQADAPVIAGGKIKRLEDVKKYLYAGAKAVFLDGGNDDNVDLMKEAADRFGGEKIYTWLPDPSCLSKTKEYAQLGSTLMIPGWELSEADMEELKGSEETFLLMAGEIQPEEMAGLLALSNVEGVILGKTNLEAMAAKQRLKALSVPVQTFESPVSWEDFKKNGDGLLPVVIQDYRTMEVLMVAYMNEEAFEKTLHSGRMTYYSRSRQTLWTKGETSGHYQYLKSLSLDCDNDTLLAKVRQVGAACHTGNKSCFFQTLAEKEYPQTNPLKVFEDVFQVILDRKTHPKEGSYTNYLFDKGIDKILKKVGEEATEIIIAAKNPDPEEIKYEISDFLYHMMVLMAEKKISWEDITRELANR